MRWAIETRQRPAPESMAAVLRQRCVYPEKSGNMPVGYAFQTLKFPDLAQLARPGAKVRGPLTYIRFREGQFNVAPPPTRLNDHEAAPPQVRGVATNLQNFAPRPASWAGCP
jgi:hypothetical protein